MNLCAHTQRIDGDVDLVSWAGDDGFVWVRGDVGIAGRGVAARLPGSAVQAFLAAIDRSDAVPGGTVLGGPVALGALPFDPDDEPGQFVVPTQLIRRAADGTTSATTLAEVGHEPVPVDAWAEGPTSRPPSAFDVRPTVPPDVWADAVDAIRASIEAGSLSKVVLAREVEIVADGPISSTLVLNRLRSAYPSCMLFSIDGFVGASPELLVERHGDIVRAQPMAGTAPRSGDPTADARLAAGLLASEKDRWEHQITIDMVHDTLLGWCSYLDAEAQPSVVSVANVQHLATSVTGRLSSPEPSVLELVEALHPTPAVGGEPRNEALALIRQLEPGGRGRYAGPVGWVDADGNGEWAVGIRSAEISGSKARVFAGVGVVSDSDPQAEVAETRAKFQALLTAIVRP